MEGPNRVPATTGLVVRHAREDDLARIGEIYHHYLVGTAITFDLEPVGPAQREAWFRQFATSGRHQLFVAHERGRVAGYADTHAFRPKRAYDPTVETTVYVAPEATGRGIGARLYEALFAALEGEDVRMAIAGITLPNPASVALHERFGFVLAGVTHEVGRKFDQYWDVAWYEKRLG